MIGGQYLSLVWGYIIGWGKDVVLLWTHNKLVTWSFLAACFYLFGEFHPHSDGP